MIDALTILTIIAAWLTMGWLLITNQTNQRKVMAKVSELSGKLDPIIASLEAVGAQLEKAKVEIIVALGGEAEIPAEALAKLEQLGTIAETLKTASQALDDLNPDAPAEPS